jgi:hypothetical protein
LGGTIVSAVTYFGSLGRGMLSAFVATFPSITVLTFILIYLDSGTAPTFSYAKGMVLFFPSWLAYLICFVVVLPRWGFWTALGSSLLAFFLVIGLTHLIVR